MKYENIIFILISDFENFDSLSEDTFKVKLKMNSH